MINTKNLSGKRDFLDVEDVCEALLKVAKNGSTGEIYNICSNQVVPIRTVLDKLISFSKQKNIDVAEDVDDSIPSFDIKGSNEKLKSITAWHPKIDLEQSLKKTLQSYRKSS